jgi:hypothetical protein
MTARADAPAVGPATLAQAHQVLGPLWPRRGVSVERWWQCRRHSARVCTAVAGKDAEHRREALVWARAERDEADRLAELIPQARQSTLDMRHGAVLHSDITGHLPNAPDPIRPDFRDGVRAAAGPTAPVLTVGGR